MPFIPLADSAQAKRRPENESPRGFIPLDATTEQTEQTDSERPSVLRNVLLNNPATAIGETALNLLSQGVAIPAAGLSGLATIAGNAMGLTDKTGADVVHAVGDALTYQPRGEMGKAAAAAVMYPFEKLAEAGQAAGNKTLDATDSPAAATAVDTAINALPMAIAPALKAARGKRAPQVTPAQDVPGVAPGEARPGFSPLETETTAPASQAGRGAADAGRPVPRQGEADGAAVQAGIERVASDAPPMPGPEAQGFRPLRSEGNPDLPGVGELREVPGRPGPGTEPGALAGQAGRAGELRAGELPMDNARPADPQASVLPQGTAERAGPDNRGGIAGAGDRGLQAAPEDLAVRADLERGREPLAPGAQGRATADLPGRDIAAGDLGEARRPGPAVAVAPDEVRMATRDGTGPAAAPREAAGRWALIEADNLKPATDTNLRQNEANPFGRQAPRHETEATVQGIVKEFEPARLVEALDDDTGAPIVARDGIVEVGQRRATALQRIYQANGAKADAYRSHLKENAGRLGLDPAAIDGMRKPVLVRLPDAEAPRRATGSPEADGAASQWVPFPPETQTLGIPRAEMPQIKGEHRGAFIQFLSGKGVSRKNIELPAASIKPTQAEYSPGKVKGWAKASDSDRSVLVSSDGYVLDGHHQWMAAHAAGEPVKAIRLDAPILDLLKLSDEFPSVKRAAGMTGEPSNASAGAGRRVAGADLSGDMPAEGKVNSFAPGANYVGFFDDTPKPGPGGTGALTPGASSPATTAARAKPIRREDILIPFMKALGTGIYEGRVKGKGVMGFFRPKLEEVRVKRHADLETSAHELAHLIDYRVPEVRKSWHSGKDWQIHREELRGLSYDASKIYEGFAEFVRHYMTQPDVAKTRAPTFYAWFEDFIGRHEYGPAIGKARDGMRAWFEQDALDRARSKIGDHRHLSEALDGRWDAFRQATVDDLHGVYRMERELRGGKIAANGPYESARLSRASASIADGALRFGAPVKKPNGSFAWKGKGLEEILKPVAENLDDALLYFVGRSARELMSQGREHLFTAGEIDSMLKLKRPEFDKAFGEYQAWNKAILDFAEAQGVINPESRALWQRTNYMPFHRVAQPDGFKGKPGDWSGIKALTGGTENIKDILGNMTANAAMLIDKAVKNEARLKIAEMAEKEHGGGKFMVKIPAEARPIKINKDAVIDAILDSMGINKANPAAAKVAKKLRKLFEDAPAMIELMQQNMPPAGGNVVAVLKGGKPTWYEVGDPILLRALESIDRQPPPWIVKWLGLPKRIGQAAITLTPDFMIANMARDTIMGSVMSRAGFRPVMDSLQGMRLRLTNDPLYKEFIANGGGLSSIFLDESKFRAKLEKFYNKQGIDYRTVLDAPDKLLGFIETLGDAFEMSTRLGEYKRAIERGESPRHAAYLGREVSTDFAMRGDSKALGFLYDTVMFLRPALVSWDRLARGLAHDPNKGAIATKAGIMALMSAGLYLLNKDDARYQDLPDWDRDSHWHFFIGDKHFRYPKIWEIGALSSAAERTAEKIIAADPQGLGKDFARILGATFNLNLMPQIIAPLYEQAKNRNTFTNAPIETPGMENMQPFMRAKPTTSETMKAAGMATRNLPEAMQVNPVRAEALLRGYFNTWALYGLTLTDKAFFADKAPTMRTDQLPVVRRFYSEEPPLNTKYETQFYDMLGEAKRLHGTLRELDKIGRSEIADEKEREPLAPEAKPMERASQNLQHINQEMRKVRRDDALTPDDKRARLDELTRERNDLLKRAVKDTEASLKAGAQ